MVITCLFMLEARCRSQRGQWNGPCSAVWKNKKYLTECKQQTRKTCKTCKTVCSDAVSHCEFCEIIEL